MTKGFKDEKGKFRPISTSKRVSRKKKSIKPTGVKIKTVTLKPESIKNTNEQIIKDIPVYNININNSGVAGKKKPFLMWVVKHPDKPDRVKDSETIVMAEHYGQAVDDFITVWNKKNRDNITIGYPQVQGTSEEMVRKKLAELPVLETNLDDIFDDVTNSRGMIKLDKLNKVAKENIEFILKRENKIKPNQTLTVDLVTVKRTTDFSNPDDGFYQYDFFIQEDGKQTKFGGTAFGDIINGDVINMQLELFDDADIRRKLDLTNKIEKMANKMGVNLDRDPIQIRNKREISDQQASKLSTDLFFKKGTNIPSSAKDTLLLQMKLWNMPLVPKDSKLRKQRDKITKKLLESARKEGVVSDINLQAGFID